MTITVKSLIEKLEKLDPNRCVYIQSEYGHYLELEDGNEVEDEDGICIITPQYYYADEEEK
jgi:hypothetical protein